MIVGWLGILKAGGAYVPLDPADPPSRLAFVAADTGLHIVVTQSGLAGAVPFEGVEVVCVDTVAAEEGDAPEENPAGESALDDLVYVMYTSGSTGRPKGVEITHRGIVRLLFGVDYATFNAEQVWLQLAPPAFDASTLEVWGALLHGGRCVSFPDRVPTPARLSAMIRRHRVNALWLTTSLFNAVVDEAPQTLVPIEQLLVGGEALSVAHVRRALAALPTTRLINGYGPTESTTFTCCYPIPREISDRVASIPIGRPIGNTRVYVLDERLDPVPIGTPGELYIGGDGLARGYRHRPELTAERFIAAPALGEKRLYRTGDRVRYLPDGNIEFLGRLDEQVKIRGFRIEPAEIEATLLQHPAVEKCVVAVHVEPGAEKRLVAHVVIRDSFSLAAQELRSFARSKLSAPMVPVAVVFLDHLPLTLNGKVDRRALPPPPALSGSEEYVQPRDALEAKLTEIWEQILGVHPIGVKDSFFDRGGHSLAAIRLFARIEKELKTRSFSRQQLLPAVIFRAPTVEQLAQVLRQEEGDRSLPSLVPIQPHGSSAPLFWIHGDGSNAFLSEYLGPDQPLFGLEHQGLDGKPPRYTRVETIAEHYLRQIRHVQAQGPYLLGGYSFGGAVAFEIAQRLKAQGQAVSLLAMLDSPAPDATISVSRIQDGSETSVANSPLSRKIFSHLDKLARLRRLDQAKYLVTRIGSRINALPRVFKWLVCNLYLRAGGTLPAPVRSFYMVEVYRRALRNYSPRVYDGKAVYFKCMTQSSDDQERWKNLMKGGLEAYEVPGDHMEVIREHTAAWAERLKFCISKAQTLLIFCYIADFSHKLSVI
jgi:amino acid adenylation domain-containing protein